MVYHLAVIRSFDGGTRPLGYTGTSKKHAPPPGGSASEARALRPQGAPGSRTSRALGKDGRHVRTDLSRASLEFPLEAGCSCARWVCGPLPPQPLVRGHRPAGLLWTRFQSLRRAPREAVRTGWRRAPAPPTGHLGTRPAGAPR